MNRACRTGRQRLEKQRRLADWQRMDRALRRPCAYPHPAGRVVRIETHISVVYLAGRYAYKICKPVDLGFADFTTVDARLECCRKALRLNQRLAPSLYVCVEPIRHFKGSFKIGPVGHPVDYALKMRRFDERDTFSEQIARAALQHRDIDQIAQKLAHFHLHAADRPPRATLGSAARTGEQLDAVLRTLERIAPTRISGDFGDWYRREIERHRAHFETRRTQRFVKACHGDLHLGNIVRRRGDLACFDCVEFSDELRWIDIAADIAFLVMDLLAHERGDLATRLLNGWLSSTGDYAGLAALRLYVVYRALVRALVAALKQQGQRRDDEAAAAFDAYLRLAVRLTAPASPFLILCHGFSGSGKSAASEALAQRLGAVRLSSDVERKRPMRGDGDRPVISAHYTDDDIDNNYARLRTLAEMTLGAGCPVIVDATFLKRAHRASFIELARDRSIPVFIATFFADFPVLEQRLKRRAGLGPQPSDANEDVLRLQMEQAEALTYEESRIEVVFGTEVPPASFDDASFWRALLTRLKSSRGWLAG